MDDPLTRAQHGLRVALEMSDEAIAPNHDASLIAASLFMVGAEVIACLQAISAHFAEAADLLESVDKSLYEINRRDAEARTQRRL